MNSIRVACYAGYRGEERPRSFTLGARNLEVREIEDQWCSPEYRFFRVRACDNGVYVLRHDETRDEWTLAKAEPGSFATEVFEGG